MRQKEKDLRIDRVPPQDVDAERALLGAIIGNKESDKYIELAIKVGIIPEIFYKLAHLRTASQHAQSKRHIIFDYPFRFGYI